jgi:hypothetical protein
MMSGVLRARDWYSSGLPGRLEAADDACFELGRVLLHYDFFVDVFGALAGDEGFGYVGY